jgi:hypothetical protein
MQSVATVIAYLAFAGAIASWVAGVVFFVRTLSAISGDRRLIWLAVFAWPFAVSRIRGSGAADAANVNKALSPSSPACWSEWRRSPHPPIFIVLRSKRQPCP